MASPRLLRVFACGLTKKERVRGEHPNPEVIVRFIGATPALSDGAHGFKSLCRQISRSYGAAEADIPAEYKELMTEFPKHRHILFGSWTFLDLHCLRFAQD